MSPAERCSAIAAIVESVTEAGTMIHTVRGVESFEARSAISVAPIAPSAASVLTASGLTSKTADVIS